MPACELAGSAMAAQDVRRDDNIRVTLGAGGVLGLKQFADQRQVPSSGSLLRFEMLLSWVRPPITKVSPSRTVADVEASRRLIVGYPCE